MQRRRITKRVLLALLVAVLWLGFLVDGSHALYSDQVTLTGNSITSSTANLLLSNSQNPTSTVFDKSRAGFAAVLSPGQLQDKFFLLKNSSVGNIDFKIAVSTVFGGPDPDGIAFSTHLTFTEVDQDGNPTGPVAQASVNLLRNTVLDTGFVVPQGVTKRYKLTTSLDSGFSAQGSSLTYDIVFSGTQVVQN